MAVSLGEARGTITISTQGVVAAEKQVKTSAANMERSLSGLGKGVGGLQNQFQQLDSFLGVSFLAGAALGVGKATFEMGKAAAQAELTRQSFDRLAAGVGQSSDELLESMRAASRGVITDSNLILGANRAIATGVADTSEELSRILEIARATGQAFGFTTSEAFSRIIESVSKLEPELLDELGITVRLDAVFRSYAQQLGTTADKLTELQRRQAFLNEIVRQTQPVVDAAAGSAGSAADKYSKLGVSWEKLTKTVGNFMNAFGGPTIVDAIASSIDRTTSRLEAYIALLEQLRGLAVGLAGRLGFEAPGGVGGVPAWMTGVSPAASAPLGAAPDLEGRKQARLDWAEGVTELNERTHDAIIQQEEAFGRQRADTVNAYQKGLQREQQDFGIARVRAEADFAESILDIRQDAARREATQAADLARMIGDARADSAERVAASTEDHEERIAEAREQANERIAESEEKYAKARERAAADHGDRLADAAGRLDAKSVYEEQRNFARQEADAKEAHDEQISALQEALQKRIDQENESYAERLADEAEALDKRIRQANEAAARQLADAKAADDLRIADMTADFEERKILEDEDRTLRLQRQADDHAAQLTTMDTAHGNRIAQIIRHSQAERTELDEEHKKELTRLKAGNAAWITEQAAKEKDLEALWDKFFGHVGSTLLAAVPRGVGAGEDAFPPGFGGMSAPYIPHIPQMPPPMAGNTTSSRTVTNNFAPNSIVINEATRPGDTQREVERALITILEKQ